MPTQPWVAGPSGIYCAVANKPLLLGVCEESPEVNFQRQWEPLYNALGGRTPSDRSYQGTDALVRVSLTRWSEFVYSRIACVHNPAAGVRGIEEFGSLGTLMATEGAAFALTVRLPYASVKKSYAGMPPAYRFVAASLDSDSLGPLSTKPRKLSLVFHCQRVFDGRTLAWKLYDHSIAGLPNFN